MVRGRGASGTLWSPDVNRNGRCRSENVGISNHNPSETDGHRKPKVSLAMAINQGLGGPKTNPKGVVDGQPVNIPAPLHFSEKWRSLVVWRIIGFPRENFLPFQMKGLPRKASKAKSEGSVLKPTQVGWCKCTKVNEWNLLKELGKKAAVTSEYGLPALYARDWDCLILLYFLT